VLGKRAVGDRALAVRLAGIELLAAAHAPELTALAEDPDPLVATEAAIASGGGAPAARALDRAATSSEWMVRAGAANLAARALGKEAAVAHARRLTGDPELSVRLAAARVLAHGGDAPAAVAIFAAVLASPESGAHRLDAAIDLAMQDDARGVQALDDLVRDPAHGSASRAAAAAAHRTAHRITPGLVAALADESAVVRVEAAAALAMLARR
jgi:HEAT repeat protein